jgi:hypothetical protein
MVTDEYGLRTAYFRETTQAAKRNFECCARNDNRSPEEIATLLRPFEQVFLSRALKVSSVIESSSAGKEKSRTDRFSTSKL